jgi:DNA-binding transcriptional MerR regulator
MPKGYYPSRNNWTHEELEELVHMARMGYSDAEIAEALGRTVNAVCIKRKRMGLRHEWDGWLLTARGVARAIGVDNKTVILKGNRGRGRGRSGLCWRVTREKLFDFVADPRYWHLWDPALIRDPALRAWAQEVRGGRRYLSVGEIARRYHVHPNAVNRWIRKGYLPGIKWGNWWVPEEALNGFVPPHQRSQKGRPLRRFGPEEDRRLLALRSEGLTWAAIGRALGRNPSVVQTRYQRLMARERDGRQSVGADGMDGAVRGAAGRDAPVMAGG